MDINNIEAFFKKDCKFLLGVRNFYKIPEFNLPEISFWGKSNVGKSSLINTLVNRTKLVKVAKTPGKTKEINFFNLNNELIITDLPGFGFAKADKTTKIAWHYSVLEYLNKRTFLKRIYLLIDSRHGLKSRDIEIMKFLDKIPRSYVIVLTKVDKINHTALNNLKNTIEIFLNKHPACFPSIIVTSSKNKDSTKELRKNIYELMI